MRMIDILHESRINECDSIIETEPKKDRYIVNRLCFEITRKCNLKCSFCLRGEAQSITMSKQVIDSVFEKIIDVNNIEITGGEPLLAIDTLEYIINKLIHSKWNTKTFSLITNGTIANQRVVELLSTLCTKRNMCIFFGVSADIFHWESRKNVATLQADTIEYYQQQFKQLGLYDDSFDNTKGIHVIKKIDIINKSISYVGLAKDLIDNAFKNGKMEFESGIVKYKGFLPIVETTSDDSLQAYAHRISTKNNVIGCSLNVTVNGDITNFQDYDYKTIDKYNFGNILNDSIESIIDNQNEQAFFECYESKNAIRLYTQLKFNCFNKRILPYLRLQVYRYEIINTLRRLIKINIEDYDISYIIKKLPVPTEGEWIDILVDLYNSIYKKRLKHIDTIIGLPCNLMQSFIDMLNDSKINYSGKYSMYLNKSAKELFYNSDLLQHFDITL